MPPTPAQAREDAKQLHPAFSDTSVEVKEDDQEDEEEDKSPVLDVMMADNRRRDKARLDRLNLDILSIEVSAQK